MNKSKTKLIIEGFQKLHSSMLEVLLDDNKTYQDATKTVFLSKIEEAFSIFKKNGDTSLHSYKGSCVSCNCPNKGREGYMFVGNNSKSHIDLIFEESDNDVNDIYHCSDFRPFDASVERKKLIDIAVFLDEKDNFQPNTDYLNILEECKLAYNELSKSKDVIISRLIYLSWLYKYEYLAQSDEISVYANSIINDFESLYYNIDALSKFLDIKDSASEAINEFKAIDISEELQLLRWLVKYEGIGIYSLFFIYDDVELEHPEKAEYLKFKHLKLDISDFVNIIKLKSLFNKYYDDMVEKYTIFTKEQSEQLKRDGDERAAKMNWLSYHIEQRGIEL